MVVERSSKLIHIVPMPKLPSPKRQWLSWWSMSLDTTAFQRTFLTGVPRALLQPGWSSAKQFGDPLFRLPPYGLIQEIEYILGCLCLSHSSSWAKQVPWVEYTNNLLPSFTLLFLLLFECCSLGLFLLLTLNCYTSTKWVDRGWKVSGSRQHSWWAIILVWSLSEIQ